MSDRRPYVGPVALGENDPIYGRDWERAELRDLLLARGVVPMHSPSGAGKTSLVQAGLLPLLRARNIEVLPSVRPGLPLGRVLSQKSQNRYSASMLAQLDDRLEADDVAGLSLLEYFLERSDAKRGLIIVDQFEEVLTHDEADLAAKTAFFRDLGAAMRAFDGLVLFCIREDYVGALEPYLNHLPTRLATRFRLDLLGQGAAMDAIQKPAAEAGVRFEKGAARYIWNSLCQVLVRRPGGSVEATPGPYLEAVQLQVVCKQVWEAPRKDPLRITRADVERLGRIDDALGRFYAEAVENAAKSTGISERHLRQWFVDRLITKGLRGQVMEGSEAMDGVPDRAVQSLVNAHVLREELRRSLRWFEVAHDRLIEPIVRDNRTWFDAHLTTLTRLTEQWYESGQSADLLLTLSDLTRFKAESARELEFVRASRVARQAERGTNLAATGWGVIIPSDADPSVLKALEPLLAHRRSQARGRYQEFRERRGYRKGDTAWQFLERHGATPGAADWTRMPYYLLLVGSPEVIPFEFQYSLAAQHAVGRLDFAIPDAYGTYARSVVMCETGDFSLPRRSVVFAPSHDADWVTSISARVVAQPMIDQLRQSHPTWTHRGLIGKTATKERLSDVFGGQNGALAICAVCHGMQFSMGASLQESHNGALLCQDWPGRGTPINPDYYYSADDVSDTARLIGKIACVVATNSAGTPTADEFSFAPDGTQRPIANRPFISALAKRLLSHPNGSALAVIGHVDRNWLYSLAKPDFKVSTGLFEDLMSNLLHGSTVGKAMGAIGQRTSFLYAAVGELFRLNPTDSDSDLLRKRLTAAMDARNFILLGDPAARLPVTGAHELSEPPVLPPLTVNE